MSTQHETDVVKEIRSEYKYGFSNPDEAKKYFFKSGRGLSHELVAAISEHKGEPDWMLKFRLKSLDYFNILLHEFEDPHTAWVAQCAMERRTLLSGCPVRRLCHDQILSTPWM